MIRPTTPFIDTRCKGLEKFQSQYAGGMLLPPVQKLVATLVAVHSRTAMQTSPTTGTIITTANDTIRIIGGSCISQKKAVLCN